MRWLSLIVAFVLLIIALFAFVGGLGPLIAIGEYSDALGLPTLVAVALAYGYLGILFGGVICSIVWFRGLRRAFGSAFDRSSTVGDWLVLAGHFALLGAVIDQVLWWMQLPWVWDLVYLLLMVAAGLYSVGLGALALMHRTAGPASGGTVS
jgi:hypothetical protein